jgi:hypothetical protein
VYTLYFRTPLRRVVVSELKYDVQYSTVFDAPGTNSELKLLFAACCAFHALTHGVVAAFLATHKSVDIDM